MGEVVTRVGCQAGTLDDLPAITSARFLVQLQGNFKRQYLVSLFREAIDSVQTPSVKKWPFPVGLPVST